MMKYKLHNQYAGNRLLIRIQPKTTCLECMLPVRMAPEDNDKEQVRCGN